MHRYENRCATAHNCAHLDSHSQPQGTTAPAVHTSVPASSSIHHIRCTCTFTFKSKVTFVILIFFIFYCFHFLTNFLRKNYFYIFTFCTSFSKKCTFFHISILHFSHFLAFLHHCFVIIFSFSIFRFFFLKF